MNANLGLTRISAVFWGFFALWAAGGGLYMLFTYQSRDWQAGLIFIACLIPLYIAHKLTCWIIAGFFAPR